VANVNPEAPFTGDQGENYIKADIFLNAYPDHGLTEDEIMDRDEFNR